MYQLYLVPWKTWGVSRAERFRQMIEPPKPGRSGKNYRGSIEAAKYLISKKDTSKHGLQWLKDHDHLDFSVENLILRPKYKILFTDEDRKRARERLRSLLD